MAKREQLSEVRDAGSTTVRHRLRGELMPEFVSARQLSARLGLSERDVTHHLEHLERSIRNNGQQLMVEPATCLGCGYVFKKRDRLSRPTGCPVCRGERIEAPRFRVGEARTSAPPRSSRRPKRSRERDDFDW